MTGSLTRWRAPRVARLWPLPALLGWAAAWTAFRAAVQIGWTAPAAIGCATAVAVVAALVGGSTAWRRVFIGAGFPVSLLASGIATGPMALGWLVAALLLLLLYPLRSWRDAPLFPTPTGALEGLEQRITLPDDARIVDAGCGLGAGLIALRRCFPQARIDGIDWSWPLVAACKLRCRDARVQRADIWRSDWSDYQLVYLFQRPESMAGALDKATRELRAGAWLVSLEFPAPGVQPTARIEPVAGKPVWLYRLPLDAAVGSALA